MRPETSLTSMHVSLSQSQKDFVQEQATQNGCSTPSEYVRRLIEDDQLRCEQERLERRLEEILESSEGVDMTPEEWSEIRATARQRLASRRRQR